MPLMEEEVARLAGKELAKINGKERARRFFMLGVKGSEAYLDIGKRRFKANQLKSLKKDEGCQVVVHGHVEWSREDGVYVFRTRQVSRAAGKWTNAKKSIAKSAAPQLKTSAFKGALLLPLDAGEGAEITSETTSDRMQKSIEEYLLYQQSMLRDDKDRVTGVMDGEHVSFAGPDGEPVDLSAVLAGSKKMRQCFEVNADGALQVKARYLKDGVLSEADRRRMAAALLDAVKQGFDVRLTNTGDHSASMELHAEGDHLEQTVAHREPASPTNLHYDRNNEVVPGSDPAMTFAEVVSAMSAPDCTPEDFAFLNTMLKEAFEFEKDEGSVSEEMSFLQYKLQFVQLDVENVDERGLRWHDGSGHLNAAEWAFLQQKVSDLPDEAQFYHWVKLRKKGSTDWDGQMMPFPKKKLTRKEFEAYIKAHYNTKDWEFDFDEGDSLCYDLPGKNDLLPKVSAFPPGAMAMLLADESGKVVKPGTDEELDLSDEADLKTALSTTASTISREVMGAAMTRWTEGSGESIKSLLQPIPDTRKVFLRQSNGSENFDRIAGRKVGQTRVTTPGMDEDDHWSGNNDNGAFGKCAPTSYFCGAVCGIAGSARASLDALKADGQLSGIGAELEALLTAVPTNESSREKLTAAIKIARATLEHAWAKSASLTGEAKVKEQARIRALWKSVDGVEQMKTSIVDRMVMKFDDEGPYMEMEFFLPDGRTDPYLKRALKTEGKVTTKVRPRDIQEYLEQTNRADGYRGGKTHMMDFYKDPSSMNQIDLMKSLGPGLIAVGVDKALKEAGKGSGLLYGPGAKMVAAMVYNKQVRSDYNLAKTPPKAKKGTKAYKAEFDKRRASLVGMLKKARDGGGGLAVSMGYSPANGHVNYVQVWGTPKIDGVEIPAEDLARCRMNCQENPGTSSAWQNDRNSDTLINTDKMIEGLTAIRGKLSGAGKDALVADIDKVIAAARDAKDKIDEAARDAGYTDAKTWVREAATNWNASDSLMAYKNSDAPEGLVAVRKAAADTMAWLKENMAFDCSDEGMNEDNIAIMPSNTERDNSSTDTDPDRDRVGGGKIGSQEYGSANAADASYFVPLNAMAGGWNGKDGDATGYAEYPDEDDQFIMLKSMEVMYT
jgi:hypothetical protein